MANRTAFLGLIVTTALALAACSPNDEEPVADPATTSAPTSANSSAPTSAPSAESVPAEGENMTREQFEAGGSELAGQAMQDWLLADDGQLPEDAEELVYNFTSQVIEDTSIQWYDEGREFAGQTSELVPPTYPAFDSYTPSFRSEEDGQYFQGIAIRIDQGSMMDFITGLSYVTDIEENPKTPGVLMSASDDEYFYLTALLDLTQVDREGAIDDWRQAYLSEIYSPIDVWRTSIAQGYATPTEE